MTADPPPSPRPPAPDAAPVEVAFLSFTEITDPHGHRAYNAWHQLDHLPEQFTLPGVRGGQRWVRTPACAAASGARGGGLDAAHYVTCYLMTPPIADVLRQFRDLAADLRRRDRFFDARRSLLSGPFTVVGAWAATRVQVAAASVPFRPTLGVHVSVWEEPPASTGLGEAATVDELLGLDGVAGVWDLEAHPAAATYGLGLARQAVRICYLDGPPLEVTPALDAVLATQAETVGAASFAGPFEAITPWQWDWFDAPPAPED